MALSAMSRRSQVVSTPASTLFRTYAGSNGNDTSGFAFSLGYYFTVATGKTLTLTEIGCFASLGGSIPPSGVTVTVKIAAVATPTTIIGSETFTNASPGTLDSATRTLLKSVSATLPAGNYVAWTYGYGAAYPVYASDQGSPGSTPVSDGIASVTLDAGVNDRYNAVGTDAPNTPNNPRIYGGPTFKGYTS